MPPLRARSEDGVLEALRERGCGGCLGEEQRNDERRNESCCLAAVKDSLRLQVQGLGFK